MTTRILPFSGQAIEEAAALIQSGELVAFATETVYGLGANALDDDAVKKVFAAKGRPQDNPLIVHLDDPQKLGTVCDGVPELAARLARAFMPGPLTMVLKKSGAVAPSVSCNLDTVAVRVPSHAGARRFLAACGLPVAAPSANTSTRPSPTQAQHVLDDMNGKIPLILDGGPCEVGIESTVVDMTGKIPVVLRPGIVTPEQLSAVVGEVRVAKQPEEGVGGRVLSPGMKYRHYAPRCPMVLVRSAEGLARRYGEAYKAGLRPVIFCFHKSEGRFAGLETRSLGEDAAAAAQCFFRLLREVETGYGLILCECPPENGVGVSLFNRMIKSAGHRIED